MKKLVCILLAMVLCLGAALAEEDRTSGRTLEELLAEKARLEAEIARVQEDEIIHQAIKTLKDYWRTEVYNGMRSTSENGYLAIRYTRVVYIQEEPEVPENNMLQNMICFVEFVVMSDYMGSAPYYEHVGQNECVGFYRDGTFSVMPNPIVWYRSRSFNTDYSDIILSISERNAEFNCEFELLKK